MTRRLALALVLIGLILIAALLGSRLLVFSPPPTRPATADLARPPAVDLALAADATPAEVTVLRVSGDVTSERGAKTSAPVPLKVGDRLGADDRVRTGATGSAELSLGALAQIELAGNTRFTIAELTRELTRTRLDDGRIAARVSGGGSGRLRVEVEGSDAVAESSRGEFSVLSSGRGQVSVATQSGTVALTAQRKTVQIGAGQVSIVQGPAPPSEPASIPTTLFLKVAEPTTVAQRDPSTTVQGTTTPGTIVTVAGLRVGADAQGHFEATVPLRQGPNRLVVEAEDALGRRTRRALSTINVDSRPPDVQSDVKW